MASMNASVPSLAYLDQHVHVHNGKPVAGQTAAFAPTKVVEIRAEAATTTPPKRPNLIVNYLGDMTSVQLRALCEQYASVVRCRVVVDEVTKRTRGYGFVRTATQEGAERVVEALNGMRHRCGSVEKRLKVAFARPRSKSRKAANVFVAHLQPWVGPDELRLLGRSYGLVLDTKVLRDARGKSKGCGFMRFAFRREAEAAIAGLNDQRVVMRNPSGSTVVIAKRMLVSAAAHNRKAGNNVATSHRRKFQSPPRTPPRTSQPPMVDPFGPGARVDVVASATPAPLAQRLAFNVATPATQFPTTSMVTQATPSSFVASSPSDQFMSPSFALAPTHTAAAAAAVPPVVPAPSFLAGTATMPPAAPAVPYAPAVDWGAPRGLAAQAKPWFPSRASAVDAATLLQKPVAMLGAAAVSGPPAAASFGGAFGSHFRAPLVSAPVSTPAAPAPSPSPTPTHTHTPTPADALATMASAAVSGPRVRSPTLSTTPPPYLPSAMGGVEWGFQPNVLLPGTC